MRWHLTNPTGTGDANILPEFTKHEIGSGLVEDGQGGMGEEHSAEDGSEMYDNADDIDDGVSGDSTSTCTLGDISGLVMQKRKEVSKQGSIVEKPLLFSQRDRSSERWGRNTNNFEVYLCSGGCCRSTPRKESQWRFNRESTVLPCWHKMVIACLEEFSGVRTNKGRQA
jgi:hypothetical protein